MASATVTKQANHYQTITDAILKALDAGVKPWARPWSTRGGAEIFEAGLPHNAASGRNYRGINVPMLWAEASVKGYTSHQWLTFNQARALGGNVRRGERSTLVYFYKRVDVRDRSEGASEDDVRSLFLMRASPVFNVAQTEGVRVPKRAARASVNSTGELGVCGPTVARLGLAGGLRFGGDRAFYAPGADVVVMPHADAFTSPDAFHAVLLHECGHATGHERRLARQFGERFGSDSYAFEELVAELCSAMSQAVLGIRTEIERHASYIDSWSQILRKDPKAFSKACTLAQQAADYLVGTQEDEADEQGADETRRESTLAAAA
jgi:antirestriction protein ArdC